MIHVLIVDDELWSLYGMKKLVDWNELGFEIRWETNDSLKAMKIIEEEEPDVVISDIVMPELTGLELLSCTREKDINTEFVFVSGFADFYYAQQAMEYGAFHYLLKPLKRQDLKDTLLRLKKHLSAELIDPKAEFSLYEQFLLSSVNNEEITRRIGISVSYPLMQAAIVVSNGTDDLDCFKSIPDINYAKIPMGKNRALVIFNCSSDLSSKISQLLEDSKVEIGLSKTIPSNGEISKIYKQCKISLFDRFVNEKERIHSFKQHNYPAVKVLINKVIDGIMANKPSENESLFSEIIECYEKNSWGISEAAFLYNELSVYFNSHFPDDEVVQEMEFMDCEQIINKFGKFELMCDYFKETTLEISKETSTPAVNENFQSLLEYVQTHFAEDLHLNDISNKFYLSSVYVCKLFKQITGLTFSKYIMNLRLTQACRLLKETNDTIFAISDQVGYNDYFYFNKIFKKNMNVTPSMYRKLKL
jgi:two-component system, response regulator YesN